MVGEVEFIFIVLAVVALDSEITALVYHRHRCLHCGAIVGKLYGLVGAADDVLDILIAVVKQSDEVRWSP